MDGNLALYSAIVKNAPQDPFLPRETIKGPAFLDTEACLCALQDVEPTANNAAVHVRSAWQCIGNQTQGVYSVKTGKWFRSSSEPLGAKFAKLPIHDASRPLSTEKPMTWDALNEKFVDADLAKLTPYDRACTAVNRTTFSQAYYEAHAAQAKGDAPVTAAPCYQPGAVPIEIQNVTSWIRDGCLEGFWCTFKTRHCL